MRRNLLKGEGYLHHTGLQFCNRRMAKRERQPTRFNANSRPVRCGSSG